MSKLIIIRGNSGSGKSTLAKAVRERLEDKRVALVGQDHLRRFILKEKDELESKDILGLIKQTVQYTLAHGYITILEGILFEEKYRTLIQNLIAENPDQSYLFYIDTSFEETVRRHQSKSNAHEFGRREMEGWYREKIALGLPGEVRLGEELTLEDMVGLVVGRIEQ